MNHDFDKLLTAHIKAVRQSEAEPTGLDAGQTRCDGIVNPNS